MELWLFIGVLLLGNVLRKVVHGREVLIALLHQVYGFFLETGPLLEHALRLKRLRERVLIILDKTMRGVVVEGVFLVLFDLGLVPLERMTLRTALEGVLRGDVVRVFLPRVFHSFNV